MSLHTGSLLGGGMTGFSNVSQLFEKLLAVFLGQNIQYFQLQPGGDVAQLGEFAFAGGLQQDTVGAPVSFMRPTLNPPALFHVLKQ